MKKSEPGVETLDQYDFPWNSGEFIDHNRAKYAEGIGDFLISFSHLESSLNILIANIINDRSHDLGYKIIKPLTFSSKINLAKDLYTPHINLISDQEVKEKKRKQFDFVFENLNYCNESRNKIVHAHWMTLDKNGYVRTKITSDKTGFVQFIMVKITPKLMQTWGKKCDYLASKIFLFEVPIQG